MAISVTHATPSGGEVNQDDYEAEHVVTGAALASHTHSGSDITSGTVADARIDSALTRDSEAAAAYAALVHAHAGADITSGTVAAARLPTLDAITAPVADVSMNTHKITGVVDPTSNQHAATKKYVDDAVAAGVSFGTPANTYGTPAAGAASTAIRTDATLPLPAISGAILAATVDTAGDRTITSATLADLPSTATSVTFVIPPSGNYLVRLTGTAGAQGTGNAFQTWGLRESTSIVAGAVGESIAVRQGAAASEMFVGAVKEFYFSGGTPGNSRTLKWAAASSTSGATLKASSNSPIIMTVIAMP